MLGHLRPGGDTDLDPKFTPVTLMPVEPTPPILVRFWGQLGSAERARVYLREAAVPGAPVLADAWRMLAGSAVPPPASVVPITWVDDRSFACLVTGDDLPGRRIGDVIRWHLDAIDAAYQGALLDTDANQYVASVLEETGPAWQKGYDGVIALSQRYQREFVEPGETPKPHQLRPFQLACQNVIIGLAAFRHDAMIDGLSVPFWQTCEVPHVATSEANRAMAAVMLCDAFQSGGTMEVRFTGHPEGRVPASLRRFGRTLGLALGKQSDDGASLSPAESRALFWAVTPMPDGLRNRAAHYVENGIVSVERLCYSLLSPIWTAPALDFLMATGEPPRTASILEGGATPDDRPARTAELELMRAALLVDMLISRANSRDAAGNTDVRTFEDTTVGVIWSMRGDLGAVALSGLDGAGLPWGADADARAQVLAIPRAHVTARDVDMVRDLIATGDSGEMSVVIVTTQDASHIAADVTVLRAPIRLSELDAQIDRNLVASTLGRV